MKRSFLLSGFAFAIPMALPPIVSARPETIPLDQIWGYDLPGTRDVRELEPDHFGEKTRDLPSEARFGLLAESLVEQIRGALKYPEPKGSMAKPGFAVLGKGLEALREAHRVTVEKQKPQQSFPEDSEISVVFFTHVAGKYVRLEHVERQGNRVVVRYRFVPHMTKNVSSHFAIIPLGKLPLGKFKVEMVQLPIQAQVAASGDRYVPADRIRQVVCQPFSFSVVMR